MGTRQTARLEFGIDPGQTPAMEQGRLLKPRVPSISACPQCSGARVHPRLETPSTRSVLDCRMFRPLQNAGTLPVTEGCSAEVGEFRYSTVTYRQPISNGGGGGHSPPACDRGPTAWPTGGIVLPRILHCSPMNSQLVFSMPFNYRLAVCARVLTFKSITISDGVLARLFVHNGRLQRRKGHPR